MPRSTACTFRQQWGQCNFVSKCAFSNICAEESVPAVFAGFQIFRSSLRFRHEYYYCWLLFVVCRSEHSTVTSSFSTVAQANDDKWYTPNFDKKLGDDLKLYLQMTHGCFEYGVENPKYSCSNCKVAKHCSKACQTANWTKKEHKHVCGVYMENQAGGGCVPVLLRSCHWINESLFVDRMRERQALFLEAASSRSL